MGLSPYFFVLFASVNLPQKTSAPLEFRQALTHPACHRAGFGLSPEGGAANSNWTFFIFRRLLSGRSWPLSRMTSPGRQKFLAPRTFAPTIFRNGPT